MKDTPKDVRDAVIKCRDAVTTEDVMHYVKMVHRFLTRETEGMNAQDIIPPDFEGQVRFGKKLDFHSVELEQATKTGKGRVPAGFKQPLPWEF